MINKEISIVIPTFNEEGNIEKLYESLLAVLSELSIEKFEIIFINDGSTDNSLKIIKKLNAINNQVKYINLSRNFGHQCALKAGLDHAIGEAVISMDADMQHPPELIKTLYNTWKQGYEVVYTLRKDSTELPFLKRKTSQWFYKLINYLSSTKVEAGAADFRLLDRKVVDALKSFNESHLFIRGIIPWLGFNQIGIEYTPQNRFSGASKYTFKQMLRLALTGITSFSAKPLYFSIYFGLFFAFLAFLYGVYALYIAAFTNQALQGWTSIIASVLFIGGIQLIMLGIIGEYLGKLFIQSKNRPNYIVSDKN